MSIIISFEQKDECSIYRRERMKEGKRKGNREREEEEKEGEGRERKGEGGRRSGEKGAKREGGRGRRRGALDGGSECSKLN